MFTIGIHLIFNSKLILILMSYAFAHIIIIYYYLYLFIYLFVTFFIMDYYTFSHFSFLVYLLF
jgi:hypothetical protein